MKAFSSTSKHQPKKSLFRLQAKIPANFVFSKNATVVETAKTIYTVCPSPPSSQGAALPFAFARQSGRVAPDLDDKPA